MLRGHGDDGYLYNKKIISDFSSNVYTPGFSEELKNHLKSCIENVKKYPEVNAESLQELIGKHHKMDQEQVLVTNGATEAFYLIGHAFRNRSATVVVPAFSEYEDACKVNEVTLDFLDWDKLTTDFRFTTEMVFIGNPNNPTGAVLSEEFLQGLFYGNPETVFILDEAYIDFTTSIKSVIPLLQKNSNIVIVKSLTKTYAIPGLRLGYLVSSRELIKKITYFKMPWSVNALAIESGKFILSKFTQHRLPVSDLNNEAMLLITALDAMDHIKVYPTHTSFFLCKTNVGDASMLKDYLVSKYGILIRDASNFRSLSPGHFRISSQTHEENLQLVKGIKEWIRSF